MLCHRGEDDVVKLLDFGLVKNLEQRADARHHEAAQDPRYAALHGAGADPESGRRRRALRHLRASARSATSC